MRKRRPNRFKKIVAVAGSVGAECPHAENHPRRDRTGADSRPWTCNPGAVTGIWSAGTGDTADLRARQELAPEIAKRVGDGADVLGRDRQARSRVVVASAAVRAGR